MNCIVCIKQVPSTNEVNLDPITKTIIRDGRQSVTNPYDTFALETAVQLKERCGGTVSVLSMGIPATERLLRDAVSRGADRGLLLTDRAFAGADTLATSYTLSLGVRRLGDFDLILCGKMAIDGDTAQIGPELAAHLGIPHVTDVLAITEVGDASVTVETAWQGGVRQVKVALPALLTVQKDVNQPRMPSIAGVKRGLEAPVEVLGAEAVQADAKRIGLTGSPTQVVRTEAPQRDSTDVYIEGDASQQAHKLAELIAGLTEGARA